MDNSDQFLAAVAASGQAVIAVRSGIGVEAVGIEHAETSNDIPYRTICTPSRFRGVESTLRFLVAGEAAQVALGLKWFDDVDLMGQHSDVANVIREWVKYWYPYPHFYSQHDDWTIDEVEEEIKHLIWLARLQIRRRFRYEPERSVIETLALKIQDRETLSGSEAERFIRVHYHSAKTKSEKGKF